MNKIHSFLRWFKSRINEIATTEHYLGCTIIVMCTMVTVTVLLVTYHPGIKSDNVVAVQAKTSFEYSEPDQEETYEEQQLQKEEQTQVTIEDQLKNAVQLSTIDGMGKLLTEQINKVQEQEQIITTALQEEEQRNAEKARTTAETCRLEELTLRQEEQKEQEEAVKQAMVDQKIQEQEEAAAQAAAELAEQEAILEQQRLEQEALLEQQRLEEEAMARSKNVIKLSSSERDVLERIVHAEAGNQDIKGRMLVANVVLNRVKSSKFPNTVREVVFQHSGSTYQFSPAKSGSVNRVKVTQTTKEAVDRVLNGEDYSKGALFFVARSAANKNSLSWFDSELTRLFTHGGHTFYK